jgi:tetratricopeptide (TPR) repeat protein
VVQNKCLNDDTLTSYLEGLLDAPVRNATEQHLIGCDNCRNQLVFYMRILDEDVREEEDSLVSAAMDQWGQQPIEVKRRRSPLQVKWLAIAASVLFAVTAGLFVTANRSPVPTPVEIVDLLLSSDRPFEARLSQQPYQPLFLTRGANSPDFPIDPLEAEMLRQAASNHMMGTFYLLNQDFDTAIKYLELAAEQLGDDAAVQNDLGVAYMEKSVPSAEELAVSLSRARQQFELALVQDAAFAPAAYNLTLLFLRLDLDAEARERQERYLELDPDSEWADEVRRLLDLN